MADTIAAVATPPGEGGIGIVRLSGPEARSIAETLTRTTLRPRHAHYARFMASDDEAIDSGVALWFKGPASFTGEDVVELQGHGGPVVVNMVLQRCLELGARPARPGEFSERAFLNDKLDLAQAEAIADLIASTTTAAARAANRSLEGVFSSRVHDLLSELIALRVFVEAAIDFPDEEDVDFLGDGQVETRIQQLLEQISELHSSAARGKTLRTGITVALTGPPNAGKSSLMNALTETDTAIVTNIPGTTRDVLREQIQIDGIPVHLVDTAGIREAADAVEAEGVRRAQKVLASADVVLAVQDASSDPSEMPFDSRTIRVLNKTDLTTLGAGMVDESTIRTSATHSEGIEELRQMIASRAGTADAAEGTFTARTRHLHALDATSEHVANALDHLQSTQASELVAEELRCAQESLGRITGAFSADDLLGEIFSSFCIGK